MFNSPFINIIISLAFIYLLLSIIVTSLNEIILTWFRLRPKVLKKALEKLFFEKWDELHNKIMTSPFIESLMKSTRRFPSYIPANRFVLALFDAINPDDKPMDIEKLKLLISTEGAVPDKIRTLLKGFLSQDKVDLDKIKLQIEKFYDESMDRVKGWYKRKAQMVTLIISLLIALGFNVDTIFISKTLWKDKEMAKKTADLAQLYSKQIDYTDGRFTIKYISDTTIKDTSGVQPEKILYQSTFELIDTVEYINDTLLKKAEREIINIQNINALIKQEPIPIGWTKATFAELYKPWTNILIKLLGCVITALGLTLGAPFWFDLLNRFINIRGTGTNPVNGAKKKPKN